MQLTPKAEADVDFDDFDLAARDLDLEERELDTIYKRDLYDELLARGAEAEAEAEAGVFGGVGFGAPEAGICGGLHGWQPVLENQYRPGSLQQGRRAGRTFGQQGQ